MATKKKASSDGSNASPPLRHPIVEAAMQNILSAPEGLVIPPDNANALEAILVANDGQPGFANGILELIGLAVQLTRHPQGLSAAKSLFELVARVRPKLKNFNLTAGELDIEKIAKGNEALIDVTGFEAIKRAPTEEEVKAAPAEGEVPVKKLFGPKFPRRV